MLKKILLAEDDEDTAVILRKMLGEAGYDVRCLTEGIKLVEEGIDWPDLFILDKDMPTIDGVALCKFLKLKEATKHIPIIMISGHHQLKKKAIKAGASAFIEKPFDGKKLLKAITKCDKSLASNSDAH